MHVSAVDENEHVILEGGSLVWDRFDLIMNVNCGLIWRYSFGFPEKR